MQARRHQYLNAMGIQVWQLRETLAGAKAVVEVGPDTDVYAATLVDQPFQAESAMVEKSGRNDDVVTAPAVVIADDKNASLSENPLPRTALAEEQPAPAASATTVDVNPEFRLASIIFPGGCMAVTQVPIHGTNPLTSLHLTFLKNVLSGMAVNLNEAPVVTFFNWPMLRSPGFDQGEAAARQASQAFLSGQKSKHTVSFVLLMGEDAGRYLLPDFTNFSESRGRLFTAADQRLLLSHSLDQLFAEPALKADLWCDIQPLRLCPDQD